MTTAVKIPVARPVLGEAEADAARRAILSGWVTQGPEVAAFEREFAAAVDAPYACAVSSCTTALHIALRALGVGPGNEVVTVSHSFIATANAVRYCDALPVFVDVDPRTFNLVPELVERAIGPRTRAILCVHQLGMPCDLRAIVSIGERHGVPVIEDAACAIGSEIRWDGTWERIGHPRGTVACFSFHPRKLLTTGDGGMLTTTDAALDRQFRLLRQHGMSVSDAVRHASTQVIAEEYTELGYNYRMTDIQAAIGREQLKRLPGIVARRRELAARYDDALARIPGVTVPREPEWARSNWQSYCVLLGEGFEQRHVMQAMLDRGVSTRRPAMCSHREPAYPPDTWSCVPSGGACTHGGRCLAVGERVQDTGVVLPLYHQMTTDEQDVVIAALRDACHE